MANKNTFTSSTPTVNKLTDALAWQLTTHGIVTSSHSTATEIESTAAESTERAYFGVSSTADDANASTAGEPLTTPTIPTVKQSSAPHGQTEPTKAADERSTEFPATSSLNGSTAVDMHPTTHISSQSATMTSATMTSTTPPRSVAISDDKRHSWCHSVPSWYGISYTLYETARMRYVYYNCGAEQRAGFYRKLPLRMAVCWGRYGWWPPITECPREWQQC